MTRTTTVDLARPWSRRTVLKSVGATAAATGLAATAFGHERATRQPVATPLERSPSTVDFVVYAGTDGRYASDGAERDGAVTAPADDFGFPVAPVAAGTDPTGTLFDTTVPTVTGDDRTIAYVLGFGGEQTPYRLVHAGEGTYRSVGAVATFEWTDAERFPLPFFAVGDRYRAVVRDVVQLYEPGGAFDWSATRTDFFDQSSGRPVVSLLTVVWDEDGPENGPARNRGAPGRAVDHPAGPSPPTFPTDATPTVDGLTVQPTVRSLVESGIQSAPAP